MAKLNFETAKNNKEFKKTSPKANGLLLSILMCTDKNGYGDPNWRTLGALARMSNFQTFAKYLKELQDARLVVVTKQKGFVEGFDKKIPVSHTYYQINPSIVLSVNEAKGETTTNRAYPTVNSAIKPKNTTSSRGFSPRHEVAISVLGTKAVNISNRSNISNIGESELSRDHRDTKGNATVEEGEAINQSTVEMVPLPTAEPPEMVSPSPVVYKNQKYLAALLEKKGLMDTCPTKEFVETTPHQYTSLINGIPSDDIPF